VFVRIYKCIERCRVNQSLLDQQRLERLNTQRHVGRNCLVLVRLLWLAGR
jgi:hypothetical protein